MPSRFEQYETLVESYEKHPDQGLKACKKKLQRDPKNITFLLAQAHFLQRLLRDQDALASCEAIKVSTKDPLEPLLIVEIQDIIARCQDSLGAFEYVGGPKLSSLWKDALDQSPKQWAKEVRVEMFRAALNNEYWDLAQQLFARLQKENPKLARYHFAWVALSQMQADKMPAEDRTGQSLRMLAYRSLKAAVDNAIQKKDTPRTISSASELRLVAQVYRQQAFDEELLALLDNSEVGIMSSIGKHDIEFIRVKIETLKKLRRWEELRALCFAGLNSLYEYQHKTQCSNYEIPGNLAWADDWYIWENLIIAGSNINYEGVLELADRYKAINRNNRNAGRAILLYYSCCNKSGLAEQCKEFLEIHCIHRSCFDDIQQFLEEINETEQRQFREHVDSMVNLSQPPTDDERGIQDWIISATNSLKIQYLLSISRLDPNRANEVIKFAINCMRVYQAPQAIVTNAGGEACILAVMSLLKLATGSNLSRESGISTAHLLQAAYLNQHLRKVSPSDYRAKLLFLLVSQLLGLGSLSMAEFRDLGLREIQFDTLSHLLYTRISSLHPFDVSLRSMKALDEQHKSPLEGINFALKWPSKALNATTNFMTKDLENVYFDKLSEFSLFKERIEKSFTRTMLQVERRRIARMTDRSSALDEPTIHFKNAGFDNRDFGCIPNYENSDASPFEKTILAGDKPGMYWLARWTLNDMLQTLLTSKPSLSEAQTRMLFDSIEYLQKNPAAKSAELTSFEDKVSEGWDLLQPLAISLVLGTTAPHASKDIKKAFSLILDSLSTTRLAFTSLGPSTFPNWTFFHTRFLHLELFKAYDKLADTALALSKQKSHHAFNKVPLDTVQKIKKEVKGVAELIQKHVKELRKVLDEKGSQDIVNEMRKGSDGEVGLMVEEVVGQESMKLYTKEFVESAIEALDGIGKMRVG